jgi:DNA excision repair protein ERCC-4
VGASRERFEACLERLSALERACVVIECGLAEFAKPPARTRIDARMAVGSYISWMVQYRVPVVWCDDRTLAERFIVRFLAAYHKHVAKG